MLYIIFHVWRFKLYSHLFRIIHPMQNLTKSIRKYTNIGRRVLFFYFHSLYVVCRFFCALRFASLTKLQLCDAAARCGWEGEWQGNAKRGREGKHGCAEIQIFARKLITRINSSQNIQTGCQTVRLHTPTPGCEPNTAYPSLDRTTVHTFAGVMRARPIRYTYYLSTCILHTGELITNGFAGRFYFDLRSKVAGSSNCVYY